MHHRLAPREHRFVYRIFLLALDLDELDLVARRVPLLGLNRRGLYSFHERDYFPSAEPLHGAAPAEVVAGPVAPVAIPSPAAPPAGCAGRPGSARIATAAAPTSPAALKSRVLAWLRAQGTPAVDTDRVLLVTLPRIFGYAFNPVSFYFVTAADGAPRAAIAEVTNTFREMKLFPLGPADQVAPGVFQRRVPKEFYVSPFSAVDVAFDFRLRVPGERLAVQIDDYAAGSRTLTSTVAGPARPLTSARLAWFFLKYPLLTLLVVARIHWHALRLWLKRLPWWAKAAQAGQQRELYRPHSSLSSPRTPA